MSVDPWLVKVIVAAVVIAWLGLTVVSVVVPGVEVPASLNGLFMTIAGGAVAMQAKSKPTKGSDDKSSNDGSGEGQ